MKQPIPVYLLVLWLCVTSGALRGQISVSPAGLYIDSHTGLASLYIRNGPDIAREVEISFLFGYPVGDSTGHLVMQYNDPLNQQKYGLPNSIRAFPRRFFMQPGGQQTVRIQVLPRTNRSDGMYWTRLVVKSNQRPPDKEEPSPSQKIGATIKYVFRQNLPVFYRKGSLQTAIRVFRADSRIKNHKLTTIIHLMKSGNAPWNGTVTATLRSEGKKPLAKKQKPLVVYFDGLSRIEMDLPEQELNGKEYRLELLFETFRKDIPSDKLVQASPVKHIEKIIPARIKP